MRVVDWPERLAAFLEARRVTRFEWVRSDCATWAAAWIEECTGRKVFEPPYSDVHGAAHYIAERGGMLAACTEVLGPPISNPASALRGDVALVMIEERQCLGVVAGEYVAGPSSTGMSLASRSAITAAWRI